MPLAEPGGDDFNFDQDDRDSTSWDGDQKEPATSRGGKRVKTNHSMQSMFEMDGSLKKKLRVPVEDGEEGAAEEPNKPRWMGRTTPGSTT